MKLLLGCCDSREEGFIGVDCFPGPAVDKVVDLTFPWPWVSRSVDYIKAYDILEHLPNKIQTMNEAHRVLKPDGVLDIFVPTTDGRGAYQDPTHVSYWNRNSFFYYTAGVPEYERFHISYGITACFKVLSERQETYPDGVVKLKIKLLAIK